MVGLTTTSLVTSRPARHTSGGARAIKEGGFEAMMGWLMERGLPMTALVDGYCGHGEGVEEALLLVLLPYLTSALLQVEWWQKRAVHRHRFRKEGHRHRPWFG